MPYYEQQRGGRCRIHALNAFFGGPCLTDSTFSQWCIKYNDEYKNKLPPAEAWDSVLSTQENIVAYVVRNVTNMGMVYIPPGHLATTLLLWNKTKLTDLVDKIVPRLFVFNADHIWMYIKESGVWFNVDSISGVKPVSVDAVASRDKRLGFMVALSMEGMHNAIRNIRLRVIANLVKVSVPDKTNTHTEVSIREMIKQEIRDKRMFSLFEVDLSTYFNYLRIIQPHSHMARMYMKFMSTFERNPANTSLIVKYVPKFIHYVCVVEQN